MRKWTVFILFLILTITLVACENKAASQETTANSKLEKTGVKNTETERNSMEESLSGQPQAALPLSEMTVKITSQEKMATFQLYDTEAAAEFYGQLPLELELSNFRDAQWMFYPPERLPVTTEEAYHDGKKGELSYYEPWGDVFMLYEDFYARDEMHRLGIGLTGMEDIAGMSGTIMIEKTEESSQEEEIEMKMKLEIGERVFTATLEDNSSVDALKKLLADGPLTLNMSDYAGMEKGADLGTVLPQNNVQMNAQAGDIILYQGNTLVIYYDTNSWSLTPIGKMDDVKAKELRQVFGTGNVTVTVSIE